VRIALDPVVKVLVALPCSYAQHFYYGVDRKTFFVFGILRAMKKLQERKKRAQQINQMLKRLYPNAAIALKYTNNWELLVSVVLSAQCTDERVNAVTKKLFKKYKTIDDYAKAKQAVIEKNIYQTGFYRNKAKNIITAAKMIKKDFGGTVPDTMESLLKIPGVARKTANIVLSNAFGKNEGIAVDTHVRRFAIRFDLSDYTDPVRIERDLMELIPKKDWHQFNHALVLYGREACPARKHDCSTHPLTRVYPLAATMWPKAR